MKTLVVVTIIFLQPANGQIDRYERIHPNADPVEFCGAWENGWADSIVASKAKHRWEVLQEPSCDFAEYGQ